MNMADCTIFRDKKDENIQNKQLVLNLKKYNDIIHNIVNQVN